MNRAPKIKIIAEPSIQDLQLSLDRYFVNIPSEFFDEYYFRDIQFLESQAAFIAFITFNKRVASIEEKMTETKEPKQPKTKYQRMALGDYSKRFLIGKK